MPRLSYVDPNGAPREVDLGAQTTIGRGEGNDVQIIDGLISKSHAAIEHRQGAWLVRDVGSRNGTLLNGTQLKHERTLSEGDLVKIGSVEIMVTGISAEGVRNPRNLDVSGLQDLGALGIKRQAPAPAASAKPGVAAAGQPQPSQRRTPQPAVSGESSVASSRETGATRTSSRLNRGTRVLFTDSTRNEAVLSRVRDTSSVLFQPAERVSDVEQLRRDYEKLRIANELTQAISTDLDLDQILGRIVRKALELFNAERGAILLVDEETRELQPRCVEIKNPSSGDEELNLSRTLLRQVTEERTAILSSDASIDSRFNQAHSIMMQGIRSMMLVPLVAKGELLGVIHLDSRVSSDMFTEKDLQLVVGFAQQAANAIQYSRLIEKRERDMLARDRLNRLLPPQVVDQVMAGHHELARGGEVRHATVLFADIRGFTSLSERTPPTRVVEMLNDYFERMVEVIFEFGGALDKFIGDEIMAVWGAHVETHDHAYNATRAALRMQEILDEMNHQRVDAGKIAIRMGIGVNTGELVAGYMGSSRAMNYTVIGDVVNTAARLCGHAGPDEILVSRSVRESARGRIEFNEQDPLHAKGKSEVLENYLALRYVGE